MPAYMPYEAYASQGTFSEKHVEKGAARLDDEPWLSLSQSYDRK
jgi:hypothetical protein